MAISFDTKHNPIIGKAEQLEDDLVVLTADNASPMTFTGTRSYILGSDNLIVIDPGPDSTQHFNSMMEYIGRRKLTDIILTHSHVDHSPLSRRLRDKTGASIIGFGSADEARTIFMKKLSSSLNLGGEEGIDKHLSLDEKVHDKQILERNNYSFEVIHTPGHLSNHICLAVKEKNALFSGDHVMGWATTLISPPDGDLGSFMRSLEKLSKRDEQIYYPGHGKPLREPKKMVLAQIAHRRDREKQILSSIAKTSRTPAEIVDNVYIDLNPVLKPAAVRNVLAHLIDLYERGNVSVDKFSLSAKFSKVN
ncbi:MBL fold metallo-hydrolase [Paracoccaceae bacterium]|nr:MBL fold metallo-hydrolase [Paracoccaceae bacterium]